MDILDDESRGLQDVKWFLKNNMIYEVCFLQMGGLDPKKLYICERKNEITLLEILENCAKKQFQRSEKKNHLLSLQ